MPSARLHWPALIVAALASFVLEAVWFTIFMNPWLAGIGHTRQWLETMGINPYLQYAVALLCSLLVAIAISLFTQWTGPQTLRRGILVGAIVWFGFAATGWAKEYIFEVRSLQFYFLNTIYVLLDYILIGAITGAWKRKPIT